LTRVFKRSRLLRVDTVYPEERKRNENYTIQTEENETEQKARLSFPDAK